MDKFFLNIIKKVRTIRDKIFYYPAKKITKIGISANMITIFSLLMGIIATYFLFTNKILFILFGLLHLINDGLDGVVARISKPTLFGKYFDYISDRIVTLLILIKIGFVLQDYYVIITAIIFILAHAINIGSKLKYPVIFSRTTLLIILLFNLPTLAYLTTGLISFLTLTLQAKKFITNKD